MIDRLNINKLHKRIAVLMLSVCIGIYVISVPLYSKAEELQDNYDYQTEDGLMEVQSTEVSRLAVLRGRLNQIAVQKDNEDEINSISVDSRDWRLYGSTYVFNQMTEKERELYNNLESVCLEYIEDSSKDAIYLTDKSGNGAYYLSAVSVEGLNDTKFVDVVQLFIYSNPQFYFTTSSYAKSGNSIYLFCYPAFADGEGRAQITNELFAKIDTWIENIKKDNDSREDIEKSAHDFLCDKLSYDHVAADSMNEGDYSGDAYYSQSVYSAVNKHKTVCAGYSLTFELLLNALGVPAVTTYSDYHAWNKVNLSDDKWYAVDVTWDDANDTRISYNYYNKSDVSIRVSDDNDPIHIAKTAEYYPVATSDYVEEKKTESTFKSKAVDSDEFITDEKTEDILYEDNKDIEEIIEDVENITESISDNDAEDVIDDVIEKEKIDDVNVESEKAKNNVDKSNEKTVIDDDSSTVNAASDKDNTDINDTSYVAKQQTTSGAEANVDTDNAYNINDKDETINSPQFTKIKSYSKKLKVNWKKVDSASGYEIQISTSKNFKKNVKKVKVSGSSSGVWIKKLKKHTRYYVRMRTYRYLNTEKIVSDWSGAKKVTTK